MDFGSVGPLQEPIQTRRQVLQKIEDASMHTTAPYRPPELFEGGVRAGDAALDYTKVDVWSLGCTLFAVLYGASPSESEFRTNGHLRIVECSQLKVLKASLPEPPAHSPVASWYSLDTHQLVQAMLTQDRHKRPTLTVVKDKLQALIQQQGGRVERTVEHAHSDHDDDDETDTVGIALMSNRNFV
jgi:serine/threonine kinase 16